MSAENARVVRVGHLVVASVEGRFLGPTPMADIYQCGDGRVVLVAGVGGDRWAARIGLDCARHANNALIDIEGSLFEASERRAIAHRDLPALGEQPPRSRVVRVGDMVVAVVAGERLGPSPMLKIYTYVGSVIVVAEDGDDRWTAKVGQDSARHADGAPIDVERSLFEAPERRACSSYPDSRIYDATKRIADLKENAHFGVARANMPAGPDLIAARERITELEARANRLSDAAGATATERDELLRENAVLRRALEKAGKVRR